MNTVTPRSLYRSCLRESSKLPYAYLRTFFRLKFRDDVVTLFTKRSTTNVINSVKLRRIGRELKKLRAANDGDRKAFIRALDIAFGRRGKLRNELLEPFLYSSVEKPPPIIPGLDRSRPPVYGAELTALHISPHSRRTKALGIKSLSHPPNLSPRADPTSEEARLLGPISKRLEVNTRWRFFTREAKKIYPPLHVETVARGENSEGGSGSNSEFTRGGFQDFGILDSLECLSQRIERPKTRRERRESSEKVDAHTENSEISILRFPNRFLRRAHQNLLSRIPKLSHLRSSPSKPGKFEVSVSSLVSPLSRIPQIDEHNMLWLQRAKELKRLSK